MINDLIQFTTLIKSRKKFHGFFIIINVLRVKILLRRRNFLVVIVLTIIKKIYFIFLALNCSVVVQPTIPTKHKKSGLKQTWGHIFLRVWYEKNYAYIMPKKMRYIFLLIVSMILNKKLFRSNKIFTQWTLIIVNKPCNLFFPYCRSIKILQFFSDRL